MVTKKTAMHAYYELETEIPANHQLTLQLPDTIPIGHVKIAIIYEMSEPSHGDVFLAVSGVVFPTVPLQYK